MKACGFPVCCLGEKKKKKKTTCGGGVQVGRVGKKKMKKKEKKHKGVFLRNEDDQVSLLYKLKRVQHPKDNRIRDHNL